MLPFVANTLCCKLPIYKISSMPKVVPDQREKFENDELFRKLVREAEVRYTGHRDRPHEERKVKFQTECREGHADIAYTSSGLNFQLAVLTNSWSDRPEERIPTKEFVDFEKEPGKVHLKSQFIMNGVCVVWKGWIDLQRLDGAGVIEYDEERARVEDGILRQQIEQYNRRLQDIEERQRRMREEQERQAEAEAEVAQSFLQFNPSGGGGGVSSTVTHHQPSSSSSSSSYSSQQQPPPPHRSTPQPLSFISTETTSSSQFTPLQPTGLQLPAVHHPLGFQPFSSRHVADSRVHGGSSSSSSSVTPSSSFALGLQPATFSHVGSEQSFMPLSFSLPRCREQEPHTSYSGNNNNKKTEPPPPPPPPFL